MFSQAFVICSAIKAANSGDTCDDDASRDESCCDDALKSCVNATTTNGVTIQLGCQVSP